MHLGAVVHFLLFFSRFCCLRRFLDVMAVKRIALEVAVVGTRESIVPVSTVYYYEALCGVAP